MHMGERERERRRKSCYRVCVGKGNDTSFVLGRKKRRHIGDPNWYPADTNRMSFVLVVSCLIKQASSRPSPNKGDQILLVSIALGWHRTVLDGHRAARRGIKVGLARHDSDGHERAWHTKY